MKLERISGDERGADEAIVAHDGGGERARLGLWWREAPAWASGRLGCLGGFMAGDEEAARAVLEGGCTRLRELGCTVAAGPMDGNTWRSHRMVTEPGVRPPFFLEPSNPPEWPRWWERAGFGVLSRYSSSRLALGGEPVELGRLEHRLAAEGVSLRPIDPDRFEDELRAIHGVCLESFSRNFLYTPLGEDEFVAMYGKVRELVRPGHVWLAEAGGEMAGFVFCLPDALALRRGGAPDFIVKTLAVRPGRRLAGLGSLLVHRAQRAASEEGFRHAIHALQHEDNSSLRITGRFGGAVMRRYALYSKPL